MLWLIHCPFIAIFRPFSPFILLHVPLGSTEDTFVHSWFDCFYADGCITSAHTSRHAHKCTWRTQAWTYYDSDQNTFAHKHQTCKDTKWDLRAVHFVLIPHSTTESTANISTALSSCVHMLSKSNAIIYVTLHSLIHHVTQPSTASKLLPDPFSISTLLLTKQKSSPTLKLALRPQMT